MPPNAPDMQCGQPREVAAVSMSPFSGSARQTSLTSRRKRQAAHDAEVGALIAELRHRHPMPSWSTVAKLLNERGVPAPRADHWTHSSVIRVARRLGVE